LIRSLARIAFFIFGIALLVEAGLPEIVETSTIERHHTSTSTTRNGNISHEESSYALNLGGPRITSCAVSASAYAGLQDGDSVEVRATYLLKSCTYIARGHEVFVAGGSQTKSLGVIGGIALIAAAFGLLKAMTTLAMAICLDLRQRQACIKGTELTGRKSMSSPFGCEKCGFGHERRR